ncbi:DUF4270 family protein [Pedobacter faecalis]|uniref:DUF4270 family protein n=1 Tax=Pedobacter faecalis TaxID=3041495 RepID=UPI00254EE81A|nr:DUF4270 family protein [Pedobacter sp. ELA7]
MKFIKQDLLTLLIGLFLFSGCKSTNSIGIEPDPDMAIEGELAVVGVNTVTVRDDVGSTLGLPRHPLGFISNDPVFGSTESALAMTVSLPAEGFSFGEDPVVDSAVLVLPYATSVSPSTTTHFYGDTTTSVYAFNVQQLQDDLALQRSFTSDREWPAKPAVIGSFKGKLQPTTKGRIVDIVPGKPDTSRTVSVPQLRIRLDKTFIQNNIADLDSATRSKNMKFTSVFKGLKVSINKAESTGPGGLLFLNLSSTEVLTGANLAIYYKKNIEGSLIDKDTASVYFPISTSTGNIAATIKHDYTGKPVLDQLNNPSPATPYQVSFLQPLAGLRSKISFPELASFVSNAKAGNANAKVVVSRAELVVNVASGTDVAPFVPGERLSLYRLDIAGQRAQLRDNIRSTVSTNPLDFGEVAFGGFYDKTNKRYVFTVTGYIQDLINGDTMDYGTYLAPSAFSEFNLSTPLSSGNRTVITSGTPGAGDKPLKLNIYYTVAN